jgi:peptidoglycan/xylan/chitin deacetylase (PgdA/CDA1 family)
VQPALRKKIRDTLIRAVGAVASIRGPTRGKRALVFHDVPDVARFRDFVDWLMSEYRIVGMTEWLDGPPQDRMELTLTFDDGYASWHESIASLLRERNIPAVFFVTSGLVGLEGRDAETFARQRLRRIRRLRFLTLSQLRDLAAEPQFEIGSHTVHHADLGRIEDRAMLRAEVLDDRVRLEDWTGTPVRWFAYPFGTPGNLSPAARSVVAASGASAAFTLIPGWWKRETGDRFLIGRDGPDPSLPPAVWRAWLSGAYDELYSLKSRLQALGRRRNPPKPEARP